MIDFRVLGTLEIHRQDGSAPVVSLTQPKRLALLLYLALAEPPGPKSRDSLMALLWPEADDESARHSLRNALYGLRQTLGDAALISRGEGYVGLDPSAMRCDALEVRRLLADQRWEDAVALWGGDLAPGFHVSEASEFEHWLDDQRNSLRRAVIGAAWRRVDELDKGRDAGLVAAAQRAWALEPANEAGARRLMRFLDASVGRAAALRAYDELADYLRRECEGEPSAETRALAREIRERVEPQISPTPPAVRADSPPSTPRTIGERGAPSENHGAAPSESSAPRRRWSVAIAGIAGTLLAAGIVSVFALRPAESLSSHERKDPLQAAERDSAMRLPARWRQDTAAYASYLRGLALRFTAPPDVARDTFAALVARNPLYAPGLSGLAHAYAMSTVFGSMPPGEGWPKVEAAARRAIALDSASASAYLALGLMEIWRWNLPRGGQLIDRGLALEPNDPEAHALRGIWFRWRRELDSNVEEARKSTKLDPLNPYWVQRLARQLYLARRYPESEAMYRQLIREYPKVEELYGELSDVYRAMGRPRDAMEVIRPSWQVSNDSAAWAEHPPTSDSEAARVFAGWASQDLRDLEERHRKGEVVTPGEFAFVYAEARDTNATLRWLDSMLTVRDPGLQRAWIDPEYYFLWDNPRYRAWGTKLPWRK